MAEVKEIHLYWYDKRERDTGTRKKVVITPSGPNPVQMKTDVAKVLKRIKRNLYKYYVVARVQKNDGSDGYRTIVPMVIV